MRCLPSEMTLRDWPLLGLQQPLLLSFEPQRRQAAGGIRPGIDIDAIMPKFDLGTYRMPVHDNFAERLTTSKEFIAYPDQILFFLLGQIDARAHPRMAEQVIAIGATKHQFIEEF